MTILSYRASTARVTKGVAFLVMLAVVCVCEGKSCGGNEWKARKLVGCTELVLYSKHDSIGDEGAKSLAAVLVLEKNSALARLDLGGNRIGAKGAKALAAALDKNSVITTLDLGYNGIGDQGAKALAAALEKNSALKTLDLFHNDIGIEGTKALAAALMKNSALTRLHLGYNSVGNEGSKALARALGNNSALRSLHLGHNGIYDEGAKVLAAALEANFALTKLELDGNLISNEARHAPAAALKIAPMGRNDKCKIMRQAHLATWTKALTIDWIKNVQPAVPDVVIEAFEQLNTDGFELMELVQGKDAEEVLEDMGMKSRLLRRKFISTVKKLLYHSNPGNSSTVTEI